MRGVLRGIDYRLNAVSVEAHTMADTSMVSIHSGWFCPTCSNHLDGEISEIKVIACRLCIRQYLAHFLNVLGNHRSQQKLKRLPSCTYLSRKIAKLKPICRDSTGLSSRTRH